MVVHTCVNASYSGGKDWEDVGPFCQRRQKVSKISISTNKLGKVVCACHRSSVGGIGRTIAV
jgi:hypothetical protein